MCVLFSENGFIAKSGCLEPRKPDLIFTDCDEKMASVCKMQNQSIGGNIQTFSVI